MVVVILSIDSALFIHVPMIIPFGSVTCDLLSPNNESFVSLLLSIKLVYVLNVIFPYSAIISSLLLMNPSRDLSIVLLSSVLTSSSIVSVSSVDVASLASSLMITSQLAPPLNIIRDPIL